MTTGMTNGQEPENQELEKKELVDEYKFISVEVGDDGSVILPKGAIPLNGMYSPGAMQLGVIALMKKEYPKEPETDLEPSIEAEVKESAIGETGLVDATATDNIGKE